MYNQLAAAQAATARAAAKIAARKAAIRSGYRTEGRPDGSVAVYHHNNPYSGPEHILRSFTTQADADAWIAERTAH